MKKISLPSGVTHAIKREKTVFFYKQPRTTLFMRRDKRVAVNTRFTQINI